MPNVFARKEVKYLLSREQYNKLIENLNKYLEKDKYFEYTICNIYYDTSNYTLFRKSIDKPVYKEKLRLRSYGKISKKDKAFLEIKKKYKGIVYKRRIENTIENINSLINNTNQELDNSMNEQEIKCFLNKYEVEPKVYLSYDRQSYFWKEESNLRITFDTNIKYRFNELSLEYDDYGEPLFDKDLVLMEVKSLNNLPLEFCKVLSELKIFPVCFSKIGTVYSEKIIGKEKEIKQLSQATFDVVYSSKVTEREYAI